eukprot:g1073.t1
MLWVDKHRPKNLKALDYHKDLAERLMGLASKGDLPHLVFHGPSGAGKKTRIMALLRELFGPGVFKMKLEHMEFKTPSKKKVEITALGSNYHTEMNPGDVGIYDRLVIQNVIKDMAQSQSLTTESTTSKKRFKVLLLTEVDSLTRDAQNALRRTMEKYSANCRLILCCESLCKVIDPLRSRCLAIRVPAPTSEEIAGILQKIVKKEGCTISPRFAMKVANASKRNMRRAVLNLEVCKVQQYPFTDDQRVEIPDWERFVDEIVREIMQEQSPRRLLLVRKKLYELLVNCIPSVVILRTMAKQLVRKVDSDLKAQVLHMAAKYAHNLQRGSKDIFHLEAFVANFMGLYKEFLLSMGF